MYVELKLNMPFEQLSSIVLGLPATEKNKLKELLLKESENKNIERVAVETENFRKLLLHGPIMTKTQYEDYQQLRKNFKQWTERLFA
jgi:hypothetical protein